MAAPTEFDISGATYYAVAPSGYSYSGEQDTNYGSRKYTSLAAAHAALPTGTYSAPQVVNVIGSWSAANSSGGWTVPGTPTATNYLLTRGIGTARAKSPEWQSSGAFTLLLTGTSGGTVPVTQYHQLDGLQFRMDAAQTATRVVVSISGGGLVTNCIVRGYPTTTDAVNTVCINVNGGAARNCVAFGMGHSTIPMLAMGIAVTATGNTLQNCLGYDCGRSIVLYQTTATITNCVAQAGAYRSFEIVATSSITSSANVSDVGSDPAEITGSVTFVDASGHDWHLSSSDSVALEAGDDLSSTFTDDGDDDTRSLWSCGPDDGPSAAAYDLEADPGSLASTGIAAGLAAARVVGAAAGSYATAGQAAALEKWISVVAETGSHATAGADCSVLVSKLVQAESVASATTGADCGLLRGSGLGADAGSYSSTGSDAGLRQARLLTADEGASATAWSDADLQYSGDDKSISADPASFECIGQGAALLRSRVMPADAGYDATTGQVAGLLRSLILATDPVAHATVGRAAELQYSAAGDKSLTAEPGACSTVGIAAGLTAARAFVATPGSYVSAEADALLALGRRVTADAGAAATSGGAASVLSARRIVAAPGSFSAAGFTADIGRRLELLAESSAFVASGFGAEFLRDRIMPAASGAGATVGYDAELTYSAAVYALAGAATLTQLQSGATLSSLATQNLASITRIFQ